jgi:transposase
MFSIPRSVSILLATTPVDLRKSIDGLTAIVRSEWKEDVFSGHLFAFVSRRGDRVKVLTWDAGGFVLYYKRLEQGRFRIPAVSDDALGVQLDGTQLAMLLDGIDYSHVRRPKRWAPPQIGQAPRNLIYPSRWQRSPKTIAVRGARKLRGLRKKSRRCAAPSRSSKASSGS